MMNKYNPKYYFSIRLNDVLDDLATRKGIKVSQRKLADILDIQPTTLNNYLLGERFPPFQEFSDIAKYCKDEYKNFDIDFDIGYLIGLSASKEIKNHLIESELGLDDTAINKLKEIKNTEIDFGIRNTHYKSNLIEPFSLILKTSKFLPFLAALRRVMHNEVLLLSLGLGDDSVSLDDIKAYPEWQLENLMLSWLREITAKHIVEVDDDGTVQGIKVKD